MNICVKDKVIIVDEEDGLKFDGLNVYIRTADKNIFAIKPGNKQHINLLNIIYPNRTIEYGFHLNENKYDFRKENVLLCSRSEYLKRISGTFEVIPVICELCGKLKTDNYFKSKKFCSRVCANTRKPNQKQKSKTSESLKVFNSNPNKKIINPLKDFKSILDIVRRTRNKLIKKLGLVCCICGWNEAICDIHHIHGKKIEDPSNHKNLTVLCPNHHRLYHNGKIGEKDVINLFDLLGDTWLNH